MDRRVYDLEFMAGEWLLLKVSPKNYVIRFGKKEKLRLRCIGPFEILQHIKDWAMSWLSVVYLVLHSLMLIKYYSNSFCEIQWDSVDLGKNLMFEKDPVAILDR